MMEMTAEHEAKVDELFDYFDKNKNGELELEEVHKMLSMVDNVSEQQAVEALSPEAFEQQLLPALGGGTTMNREQLQMVYSGETSELDANHAAMLRLREIENVCGEGWLHTIALVPTASSAAMPYLKQLMQQPYPDRELQLSRHSVIPATDACNDDLLPHVSACMAVIRALPPVVFPEALIRVEDSCKLVLSAELPAEISDPSGIWIPPMQCPPETVLHDNYDACEAEDFQNILSEAVAEVCANTWEYAYVCQRDHGLPETGGLPRELRIESASAGMREYFIRAEGRTSVELDNSLSPLAGKYRGRDF